MPVTTMADEIQTRKEIQSSARELFSHSNFDLLNRQASIYLNSQSRTSSGLWELSVFYLGLANLPTNKAPDPKYWADLKTKLLKWSKLDNDLSFPHMVYANKVLNQAWMYRGSGWGHEVKKENWKPFREKIEESRLYLIKHSHFKSIDPRWHETMLVIAKAQGWSIADFYKLLDEALSMHPQFYEIYFRALDYLLPIWHGSIEEVESFAIYATKKSQDLEGQGMYARIYWYLSQAEYGHALFTKSKVRWGQMKLGIEDVMKKYPDQWNINNFAVFSCLAGDKDMTKKLMNMLQDRPIISVWKSGRFYEHCKSMAAK